MRVSLKRKKDRKDPPVVRAASSDFPKSLTSIVAQTRPIRILAVDIDEPLPDLRVDNRFGSAYVLLSRNGVYVGEVVIDLSASATSVRDRLREKIIQLKTMSADALERPALIDSDLPRISIVVPTIGKRIEELRRCIENIEQLDYPDFELLLVDNRQVLPATDQLPVLTHGRPWLRVIRESRPGISAARNKGVSHADGDVIAFTDDDVQVDRQWLRAIGTRMVLDPRLDAVTGLVLPAELDSPAQIWFERYYGGFNGQRTFIPLTFVADRNSRRWLKGSKIIARDSSGGDSRRFAVYGIGAYAAGANMAFRKSTLERIGGFDVALGTGTPSRGGEDLASIITILWTGGQVGYEPTAFVHHQHRREYEELLTLMDGNGIGFTAMLTSLVRNDPRHLLGLTSQLGLVLKQISTQRARKIRGLLAASAHDKTTEPRFPSTMAKREFRAYLRGPWAYARSRSAWRELSATGPKF